MARGARANRALASYPPRRTRTRKPLGYGLLSGVVGSAFLCLVSHSLSDRKVGKEPTHQPNGAWDHKSLKGTSANSTKIQGNSNKTSWKYRQNAKCERPNHPRASPFPE